jgi:hypothetical protein
MRFRASSLGHTQAAIRFLFRMASSRSSAPKKSSKSQTSAQGSKAKASTHGTTRTTAEHSGNPSSTGHGKAKKEPAKQTSRCWPGYEPVHGTAAGEKGSCKPKAHQTAAERKSDGMAAAASKLRKAGGNKAGANHSK